MAAARKKKETAKQKHARETLAREKAAADAISAAVEAAMRVPEKPKARRVRVLTDGELDMPPGTPDKSPFLVPEQGATTPTEVTRRAPIPSLKLRLEAASKAADAATEAVREVTRKAAKEAIIIPSSPPPTGYTISFKLTLSINKQPKLTPMAPKVDRDSLDLTSIWRLFESKFRAETEPLETVDQTIFCIIKDIPKRKSKREYICEDWTSPSAEGLLAIMDELHGEKQSDFEVDLTLKVVFSVPERNKLIKAASMVSSPPSAYQESPAMNTGNNPTSRRAEELIGRSNARIQANLQTGSIIQALRNKWSCSYNYCKNIYGWCYRKDEEEGSHHYTLETPDFEKWHRAIEYGTHTVIEPPPALMKYLEDTKGPNSAGLRDVPRVNSRQATKDIVTSVNSLNSGMSAMEKMIAMQTAAMEKRMMRDMEEEDREERELRRRDRRRRLKEKEREMSSEDDSDKERYKSRKRMKKMVILPSSSPQQSPRRPIQVSNPVAGILQLTQKPRNSSPVYPEADDSLVIRLVFDWKKEQIADEVIAQKWQKAYDIIVENLGTIDHLKAMSDGNEVLFNDAKQAGIPTGLILQFRQLFAKYKLYIKEAGEEADGAA